MAGYIGNKAVGLSVTTGDILGDVGVGGDVLVGKSSAGLSTAGVQLDATGSGGFCRAETCLTLSRLSTDGSILDFRKDSTTVGSIGTVGADLTIGTGDVALRFQDGSDNLIPHNVSTNTTRDAGINIGTTGARFKDLYLSGGVYLGGTGAANKLDDVESGTWTPVAADAVSGGNESSTTGYGYYVKVGAMVYVHFNISNISTTGLTAGNDIYFTGLPFAARSVTGNAKYTGTAHMSVVTFSGSPMLNVNENQTAVSIIEVISGAGVDSVVVSQISSGASDVHGNLCYETT